MATKSRIRRSFGKGKNSQFELEELDSDLSNVLLCGIKGRQLCDPYAQKLRRVQRTVWDSRPWDLERWECAVSRAANEFACHMHALQ